ncbi:hypothetical protein [Trichormus azollae]|uniref:hypothetical protein n=1 Tax=Trichormus azollae TaxID=1164 RepID=UPI00325CB168
MEISIIELVHDLQAREFLRALDNKLKSIGAKLNICDSLNLEVMILTDVLIEVNND